MVGSLSTCVYYFYWKHSIHKHQLSTRLDKHSSLNNRSNYFCVFRTLTQHSVPCRYSVQIPLSNASIPPSPPATSHFISLSTTNTTAKNNYNYTTTTQLPIPIHSIQQTTPKHHVFGSSEKGIPLHLTG